LNRQLAEVVQERDAINSSFKDTQESLRSEQAALQREHNNHVETLENKLAQEAHAHQSTQTRLMEVENILEVTRNASQRSENCM
jgi:uncharacterized protein YigA (DUF484 family)